MRGITDHGLVVIITDIGNNAITVRNGKAILLIGRTGNYPGKSRIRKAVCCPGLPHQRYRQVKLFQLFCNFRIMAVKPDTLMGGTTGTEFHDIPQYITYSKTCSCINDPGILSLRYINSITLGIFYTVNN